MWIAVDVVYGWRTTKVLNTPYETWNLQCDFDGRMMEALNKVWPGLPSPKINCFTVESGVHGR